ncbi:MAG: ABC transporter permease [Akkermansia sp.]|nr:ABC transporter permease [Akkermansia sp.]
MKFLPLLKTCIKALVRNPMRASLTILGIIIGIAAVIAMVEIGRGSTEQIRSTLASMGADTLNIRPGAVSKTGINTGAGGRATLTYADSLALMSDCNMVIRSSPVIRANGQVIYGNKNWKPETVVGGSVEYLQIKNWSEMETGQPFTEEDVDYARRVCVIGQTVASELFGDFESALGKDIRIKNVMFKVIGVLKRKGANMMGQDQDDCIIIPWTSVRFRLQGLGGADTASSGKTKYTFNRADKYPSSAIDYYTETTDQEYTSAPHPRRFNNIDSIMAQITIPERSSEAIDEITAVIREKHKLRDGQLDDFRVWDMAEMSRAMSSTSEIMTSLLTIVAMISLVVGGVGIMNIMLVSVTERTKEIGLRMAVGARPCDIMSQFLLEAVLLCLVGGILGIGTGKLVSYIVSTTMKWSVSSAPEAMILAVAVSAIIGLGFGWYPAWKASRMDPIDALRHE